MDKEIETVIIAPSSNLEGDITSCGIEKQHIRTDRKSLFALREYETYITYDVCNKEIISEYTVPTFTGIGLVSGMAIIILSIVIIGAWLDR